MDNSIVEKKATGAGANCDDIRGRAFQPFLLDIGLCSRIVHVSRGQLRVGMAQNVINWICDIFNEIYKSHGIDKDLSVEEKKAKIAEYLEASRRVGLIWLDLGQGDAFLSGSGEKLPFTPAQKEFLSSSQVLQPLDYLHEPDMNACLQIAEATLRESTIVTGQVTEENISDYLEEIARRMNIFLKVIDRRYGECAIPVVMPVLASSLAQVAAWYSIGELTEILKVFCDLYIMDIRELYRVAGNEWTEKLFE